METVKLLLFSGAIALSVSLLLSTATASGSGPITMTCARSDPNINECMKTAITAALRSLKDGYAALSVPPLDPSVVPHLELTCPGGGKANLSSYVVEGTSHAVCDAASFTSTGSDSFELSFDVVVPRLDAAGAYSMRKGFLGAADDNSGSITFNFTNYRIDFVLSGVVANGFATFTGKSSTFKGGVDPKVFFSNAGEELNRAVSAQPAGWIKAYGDAVDAMHPFAAAYFANALFGKLPIDELFPATR